MGSGEININRKFENSEAYLAIKSALAECFPSSDGWKLLNRYNWVSYIYRLVVQRQLGETNERILVEVNLDNEIAKDKINEFIERTEKLNDDGTQVIGKVYIGNSCSNLIGFPNDIKFIELNSFLEQGNHEGHNALIKLVA